MYCKWFRRLFLMLALAAALVVSFLPVTSGEVQACNPYAAAYTQQAYSAPTYQQAYTQPVTACYQQPYKQQYVAPIKAVKAQVNPDVYSSIQDTYRDKLLVDAIAGRTQELMGLQTQLQQLQAAQQQIQAAQLQSTQLLLQQRSVAAVHGPGGPGGPGGYHGSPNYPQGPGQGPGQAPVTPPPPRTGRPPGRGSSTVPPGLEAIVAKSCLRCHGASHQDQGGGFDLRDLEAVDREHRFVSYMMVNTGEMPMGGKPLSDQDVAAFKEWAKMAPSGSRSPNRRAPPEEPDTESISARR
jgi:hypothetical protein